MTSDSSPTTSTVSTWQHTSTHSASSSRASYHLPSPSPALFHVQLLPRITSAPSLACCTPNEVVVELATALIIPDYSRFYDTPIQSFHPTYHALDDGSLVAPPYTQDLLSANANLLINGMLVMLFARNILVSCDYIQRCNVKRKSLFYILLLSQLLAPISLIPVILSFFNQHLNCTACVPLSLVTPLPLTPR